MLHEVVGVLWLLLPLLGGASLHGLCMRYGWLSFLARPIDAGRQWRGRPIFGGSKTWRGPVAVALGAWLVYGLQRGPLHQLGALRALELVDYATLPGAWFGLLLGGIAELAELPNSFVKRRLGIAPGGTARGVSSVLFYLWDQLDVLLGYWLVLAGWLAPSPLRLLVSVGIAGVVHPLLTLIGFLLGMRPTAR
jgi:hypothetical protein